jgi:putative SOS response-associated peptidase YedK
MATPEQQIETASSPAASDDAAEIERLRARITALEAELAEVHARANAAIAAAQERAYWLDRWHIDANELMRRRGASELRSLVRAVRSVYRSLRTALRSLRT